jgi:hypothetical protein
VISKYFLMYGISHGKLSLRFITNGGPSALQDHNLKKRTKFKIQFISLRTQIWTLGCLEKTSTLTNASTQSPKKSEFFQGYYNLVGVKLIILVYHIKWGVLKNTPLGYDRHRQSTCRCITALSRYIYSYSYEPML